MRLDQKNKLTILLILVMLFTLIPTSFTFASTPSQWAAEEIEQAKANQLTTNRVLNNYQQNITREEFSELAVKLYEALSGQVATPANPNPFKDTTNPEILKANKLGIVSGISADQFAPNQPITRQEISVMLVRTIKAINPSFDVKVASSIKFNDESEMDSWAIEAVKYLNEQGIIQGVGNNRINPKGNTSREQAILLTNRTFNKYNNKLTGKRDTLNIGIKHLPVSLDPHRADDLSTLSIVSQIYDTLIVLEKDQLVPGLAKSWKKVDSLTYEFILKQGIKFHNGDLLTAKDVAFSLKRSATTPMTSNVLEMLDVDRIQVIDDYTIRISTKKPFTQIINRLAHINTAIISERAAGGEIGTKPVGTGPYQFVSKSLIQVNLTSNDQYYLGKPTIPKVNFHVSSQNMLEGFQEDRLDIAYGFGYYDAESLVYDNPYDSSIDYKVFLSPAHSIVFLGFNTENTPFSDPRVRHAVNYATDVQFIGEVIYGDFYRLPASPVHPSYWGANVDIEPYGYNISYARKLLTEAGYENGFKATLWISEGSDVSWVPYVIKEDLALLNIEVEIVYFQIGDLINSLGESDDYDMYLLGWRNHAADVDYALYPLFHSTSAYNYHNYSNPIVDNYLDLARETNDQEMRKLYYQTAQELIDIDAPWITLWYGLSYTGVKNNVSGLVYNQMGYFHLWKAKFE